MLLFGKDCLAPIVTLVFLGVVKQYLKDIQVFFVLDQAIFTAEVFGLLNAAFFPLGPCHSMRSVSPTQAKLSEGSGL